MATATATATTTTTTAPTERQKHRLEVEKLAGALEFQDLMAMAATPDAEAPPHKRSYGVPGGGGDDVIGRGGPQGTLGMGGKGTWRQRVFSVFWPETRRGSLSDDELHRIETLLFDPRLMHRKLGKGRTRLEALNRTSQLKRRVLSDGPPSTEALADLQMQEFLQSNNEDARLAAVADRQRNPSGSPSSSEDGDGDGDGGGGCAAAASAEVSAEGGGGGGATKPAAAASQALAALRAGFMLGQDGVVHQGGGKSDTLSQVRFRGGTLSAMQALSKAQQQKPPPQQQQAQPQRREKARAQQQRRSSKKQGGVAFGASPAPSRTDSRLPLWVAVTLPVLFVAVQLYVLFVIDPKMLRHRYFEPFLGGVALPEED